MPSLKIDLKGKRFDRLVVVEEYDNIRSQPRWVCICDCGNKKIVRAANLLANATKSCGCKRETSLVTHGLYKTPEYGVFKSMISRCHNPNDAGYKWYGSKGVKVCKEWKSNFLNFLKDMGKRPAGKYSIDRINSFGNYEPSNCRWATAKEQANNQRRHYEIEKLDRGEG